MAAVAPQKTKKKQAKKSAGKGAKGTVAATPTAATPLVEPTPEPPSGAPPQLNVAPAPQVAEVGKKEAPVAEKPAGEAKPAAEKPAEKAKKRERKAGQPEKRRTRLAGRRAAVAQIILSIGSISARAGEYVRMINEKLKALGYRPTNIQGVRRVLDELTQRGLVYKRLGRGVWYVVDTDNVKVKFKKPLPVS